MNEHAPPAPRICTQDWRWKGAHHHFTSASYLRLPLVVPPGPRKAAGDEVAGKNPLPPLLPHPAPRPLGGLAPNRIFGVVPSDVPTAGVVRILAAVTDG